MGCGIIEVKQVRADGTGKLGEQGGFSYRAGPFQKNDRIFRQPLEGD
ncbi:MAG: hypothetical protein NVS3B26_08010 [Mycobacteriales bacterium]